MKKLSIALLAITMILSLAACGNSGKESTAASTKAPETTQAPETTKAPQ